MKKKKILVAEDDVVLAGIYRNELGEAGYSVECVKSGDEVLASLAKSQPDLMILDLVLPGKNGFAVLADLKSSGMLGKFPVMVATNLDLRKEGEKLKEFDVQSFLVKSDNSLKELLEKVGELIGKARKEDG